MNIDTYMNQNIYEYIYIAFVSDGKIDLLLFVAEVKLPLLKTP